MHKPDNPPQMPSTSDDTLAKPQRRAALAALASLATAPVALSLAMRAAPALAAGPRPAAPELTGITGWINSPALRLSQLRGKVVLLEFWALGCINCIHTLPQVVAWDKRLRARGLVTIGVHTPEFPAEAERVAVDNAVKRHGIAYPVAMDNQYQTWQAFNNQYWPALYLIDRQGRVAHVHVGEGRYAEIEAELERLLQEPVGAAG